MDALMPVFSADDEQDEQIHIAYEPLTPSVIEDEKAQSYIEALNFACSRPNIRNIAVTGPYGAGKSSVLLTWEKAENNNFRVMTVSLADFEMQQASSADAGAGDGRGDGDIADKKATKAEEKTIEYSILQQLLYKEKKSVLPYSRLERISDVSTSQIAMMTASLLLILALTATGLLFLFPDYIRAKLSFPKDLSQFILALPVLIRVGGAGLFLFSALFLALKKLHRTGIFDRRVSIDKVDILKGAISTRATTPSLLNVYIDEIVYFFEQTQYNVVIFEDLDRHNDGAIFIKLREINQLINNCLPADRPVRFIYAVRDNLFSTPESRTKFFDFVMPVIPVMDTENASEHFFEKFTSDELKEEGFRNCLARLALFIPDMRVMHNIANEFRLYRNIVNNGEDLKRLIALLAYKNLCAEDYHRIDQKNGLLYSIVAEYTSGKLREKYCTELKTRMAKYQRELEILQNEKALQEPEVRREIIHAYINEKTASVVYILAGNGTQYDLETITEDESAFYTMLSGNFVHFRTRRYNQDIATIDKTTIDYLKTKYEERKTILREKTDGGLARLEEKIKTLSYEIQNTFSCPLAFFINKMGRTDFGLWATECTSFGQDGNTALPENTGQIDFLYFLLSHGYLSTDYMAYRSVFIPGSLSTDDNNFIRAVTTGRTPDETAEMPLSSVANTVAKLRGLGMLMHDNAWHSQVLNYLMYNDTVSLKTIMGMQVEPGAEERMVRLASHIFPRWESAARRTYIQLMVVGNGHLPKFIHQIRRLNDSAAEHTLLPLLLSLPALPWNAVSEECREELQLLIDSQFNLITSLPESCEDFFYENLRNSGCRLTHIPLLQSTSGKKILQLVAQEKLWLYSTFNLQNLCLSLTHDAENGIEIFRKKPMATIRSLRIPALESYVDENLSSFVRDVFIHSEENELIPEILNLTSIDWDDSQYLIARMQFMLDDITVILNKESNDSTNISHINNLYSFLAESNRIAPSWSNIVSLLDDDAHVSGAILCEWLNINHSKLKTGLVSLSVPVFSQLINKVILSGNISKKALVSVTEALRINIVTVPEDIPLNNAAVLIAQQWLAPTSTVCEQLYQTFYEEGDHLTPLLYEQVCMRPSLLSEHCELILFAGNRFNRSLARSLLNGGKIADEVCISVLNWIWNKDEALLIYGPLLNQQTLSRLSGKLTSDRLKQALLIQCLKDSRASHTFIRSLLMTFGHPDYAAFITERSYRSIPYSDSMLSLAVELANSGFIRPPKPTHENTRIRIEPFSNGEKEYD